jgi:TolB protein
MRSRLAAWLVAFGIAAFVIAPLNGTGVARAAEDLGIFDAQADVGTVSPPGTARFDKATQQYRITSSGQNVWGTHDDFHFVYRKASGDMTMTADIALAGESKGPHRKGGLMIRQGLEPDAAYVDVMVHGDGLIGLQYRTKQGGPTADTKATVKSPASVRLERHGNTFSLCVAPEGEPSDKPHAFERVGSVKVELKDPVYVGLAVCSHDAKATETAVFSNVSLKNDSAPGTKVRVK